MIKEFSLSTALVLFATINIVNPWTLEIRNGEELIERIPAQNEELCHEAIEAIHKGWLSVPEGAGLSCVHKDSFHSGWNRSAPR